MEITNLNDVLNAVNAAADLCDAYVDDEYYEYEGINCDSKDNLEDSDIIESIDEEAKVLTEVMNALKAGICISNLNFEKIQKTFDRIDNLGSLHCTWSWNSDLYDSIYNLIQKIITDYVTDFFCRSCWTRDYSPALKEEA